MQLQADLAALEAAGIWPVALSYDSRATVAAFAAKRGITFPLLADEGSVVIRQLGLLNTAIAAEHPRRGVARPATYLLDQDGRVERVILHASQTVGDSWPTALRGAVDLRANASGPVVRHTAAAIAFAVSLDSATYAPRQRVGVRLRADHRRCPRLRSTVTARLHTADAHRGRARRGHRRTSNIPTARGGGAARPGGSNSPSATRGATRSIGAA